MIDGALAGLALALSWPAIGYLFLGIFMGMWIGAVPGLGGVIGLVLLLPFTFAMDPAPAFALLLGMYAVTSTSDTISSVLLGIPGTVASQATVLDGHPLAKQGQAARAFGAAYTVSAFGGVAGALLLAISLSAILPVIFAFGVAEFFMLAVLGLAMVGALSGGSIVKGMTVALFGLLLTTVGYADATGVPRFYLGTDYLLDGIPVVPIVLGLFGIPELMEMAVGGTSIARGTQYDGRKGGMARGVRDALHHRWLVLRCTLIGTYIGVLPGLGGAIVDWIAYGHAVQGARDKSRFGSGDIRGVIAPEAANNASKAGALIPTVAFGIPGNLGAAILLGALAIKGLRPGPEMLTTNLPLTFSMIWDIAIANVVAAGALMLLSRQIARIAFAPGHLVVPGVILVLLMGAWLATSSIGDWWTCLAMGALGYVMKQSGWPRPPLILALVLGTLMENNLQLSMQIYGGFDWLIERPIVVVIEIVIIATVILAARGIIKTKGDQRSEAAEGGARNPLISLPLAAGLLVLFVCTLAAALGFEDAATAEFPLAVVMAAIPLALVAVVSDARAALGASAAAGGLATAFRSAAAKVELGPSATFLAYLLAVIAVTYIAGQLVALPLFVGLYLWRWGGYGWAAVLGYTAAAVAVIWGFYGEILHLHFHPSLLFG